MAKKQSAPKIVEKQEIVEEQVVEQSAPETLESQEIEPIKPVLTDNLVDAVHVSNTIVNEHGVKIKLSDIAAKNLARLQPNVKFVK